MTARQGLCPAAGLALAFVLTGAIDVHGAGVAWQGVYECGQHRLSGQQGPFKWQLRFEIDGGKIAGTRDYIGQERAAPAIATFTGYLQDDGSAELAVWGRYQADQAENFHSTLTGRQTGTSIVLSGAMRFRNQPIRQCQLIMTRQGV